jgi:hypothetical protein
MTSHKIFYYKRDSGRDIVRTGEYFNSPAKYSYHECPVWVHKSSRTFTFESSFNIKLFLDQKNNNIDVESDLDNVQNYLHINNETKFDDVYSEHPVIQLSYPEYFLWTDSADIWVEFLDHPLTSYNNNMICLGGWWNISNYPRGTNSAFQIVNPKEPVIIKEGDPLFRIRFFSKNFDDGFTLIEKNELNQEYESFSDELSEEVKNNKNHLQEVLFKKSCPFSFLFPKKNV